MSTFILEFAFDEEFRKYLLKKGLYIHSIRDDITPPEITIRLIEQINSSNEKV